MLVMFYSHVSHIHDSHVLLNVVPKSIIVNSVSHIALQTLMNIQPLENLEFDHGDFDRPWRQTRTEQIKQRLSKVFRNEKK